jgi:ATP-binding cassette subfamily F protein 3
MSLLIANELRLSFGDFDLFQGISVMVANDSKIGLIGPNGIGKTSLLLILAEINQPTSGRVILARGRKLGYLRQEAMDAFADRDNTVFEEMLTIFNSLQMQQHQLHELEEVMASGDYDDGLIATYGKLQEQFEHAGGYDYEIRIQQTLQGLGLAKSCWNMPLKLLSGGQKTRALLARLLLEKPDLLILDEPTNHLDIEAVEWLEKTLREWNGAILIVSHDRYFLDAVVNTIWDMDRSGLEVYSGNYSDYLMQRRDRWEWTEKVYKEEKARLLHQVDFIQKNWVRASTHARALGLLRRLTRELAVVDNFGLLALRNGKKWHEFELREDRPLDLIDAIRKVNAIEIPSGRPPSIRPRLNISRNSGNIVLRAEEVEIGYPGNRLFTVRNLELRRGECAALIGPNGSGKTTFLKSLLDQIQPLSGEVQLGAGLKIGYFAQAQDALDNERSVLDELLAHKAMQPQEARGYLAQYLFRGEDVFKQISLLSGGERARLALAILALEGANFLLLDEPTNHLDIPSREALQDVLSSYDGTILLVSHDRYLINQLATQIWVLSEAHLLIFNGSYRDYVLKSSARPDNNLDRKVLLPQKMLIKGDSFASRKRIEQINMLETRIREQEASVRRLTQELQKAGAKQDYEKAHQVSWAVAQAQATLDELMSQWESLAV